MCYISFRKMNDDQFNNNPKMQPQPPPYTIAAPPPQVIHAVQPGATVVHTVQPAGTVVHTQMNVVPVMVGQPVGPQPVALTCKSCNHEIVTRLVPNASLKTHLFAALLCLVGCWPCACIPYCMTSCHNINHYCPNCNSYVGTYAY